MSRPENDAICTEAALIRAFLLSRLQAGADPRVLMVAHAAVLGHNVAVAAAAAYLESSLDLVISTIRYNALLAGPEAGNA